VGSIEYNTRTTWYLDKDAVRKAFVEEKTVRGVTYKEVEEQTGINNVSLNRFANGLQNVSGDAAITLIKWSRANITEFVKRRGRAYQHKDTPEQAKIRTAQQFLSDLGVEVDPAEHPFDAMARLISQAKDKGLFSDE
jgi:hypothetical protein